MRRAAFGFPAFQRPLAALLALSLAGFQNVPLLAGSRDEAFGGQTRSRLSDYQTKPFRYEPPTQKQDRQIELGNAALEMRFRGAAPQTFAKATPIKNAYSVPQPRLQLGVNKPIQTPAYLKVEPKQDLAAAGGGRSLLDGARNAFRAMGQAVLGVARKIGEGFRNLLQKVLPSLGSAKQAPDKSLQAALKNHSTLQAVPSGDGLLRVQAGKIAHVQGRVWEGGSTFKAEGGGLRLVEGVSYETQLGGIQRADGKTFPIVWQGDDRGGFEPTGLDFSKLQPDTAFRIMEPVQVDGLGEIAGGELTFLGATPGGREAGAAAGESAAQALTGLFKFSGARLNAEPEGPVSSLEGKNLELSMISFVLQKGGMTVGNAVFTQGDRKLFLSAKGEVTDVTGLDERAEGLVSDVKALRREAGKASRDIVHGAKAANVLMSNLTQQTGIAQQPVFEPQAALEDYSEQADGLVRGVEGAREQSRRADYEPLIENLPALEAQAAGLEFELSAAQDQADVLKAFMKAIRGLGNAHMTMATQADPDSFRQELTDLEQLDRAARHFPAEKAEVRIKATDGLNALRVMVDMGAMAPEDARMWGMELLAVRNQLLAAAPPDTAGAVKGIARDTLNEAYGATKGAIDVAADRAFFDYLDRVGEAAPRVGIVLGTIYLAEAKAVSAASHVAGYGLLAYGALTASITTGAAVGAAWITHKGLTALGVEPEAAAGYSGVLAALVGGRAARSKAVRAKEGRMAETLLAKAEGILGKAKESVSGLAGRAAEPVLNEGGFVSLPGPRGAILERHWGAHNGPGPLGKKFANTFRAASYTEKVLQEDTILYRAYGGKAKTLSPFWTRTRPTGPLQSKIDSALHPNFGNTAEKVATIRVPKGTVVYEGAVAPQGPLEQGGGNQIVIPKVDSLWLIGQ